jgi:hypothetical protein
MATIPNIAPVSPVDRLGEIRAEIARLKEIEAFLIEEVKALGVGVHEGAAYRAAVSIVEDRNTLDVKAAEAKLRELGVDGRWFSKHQKTIKGYTAVRVSARKP